MNVEWFIDMTLREALLWLTAAGLPAWAIVVSNVLRNIKQGEVTYKWAQKIKGWDALQLSLLNFAIYASLPSIAYGVLLAVPPEVLANLDGLFQFVAALFTYFLAQQGWYLLQKWVAVNPAPSALINTVPTASTGKIITMQPKVDVDEPGDKADIVKAA